MFAARPSRLPQDPTYVADFKELGYFVNNDGLIRKIEYPDDTFQFFITNNERYNEVHREAFHKCIRREVATRLKKLSLTPLYLPSMTTQRPDAQIPHLTILITPETLLRQKERIIVVMNQLGEDLGILSWRAINQDSGLDGGSIVSFVREIYEQFSGSSDDNGETQSVKPGIIVLNPGQLLYSYSEGTATSRTTWSAKPRKSAVHQPSKPLPGNYVPRNETVEDHLKFVFESVIGDERFVKKGAEILLVGLGDGGNELVKYLEKNWRHHTTDMGIKFKALALTAPLPITPSTSHIPLTNEPFLRFLSTNARAWAMSDEPLNKLLAKSTPLPLPAPSRELLQIEDGVTKDWEDQEVMEEDYIFLCPYFSGGEQYYPECVMTTAYKEIAEWLADAANGNAQESRVEGDTDDEDQGQRKELEDEVAKLAIETDMD